MRFSFSLACSCVVIGSLAGAQSVDLSQLRPVTSSAKHAGVYDVTTGKFHPAGGGAASSVVQTIYLNNCNSGASFFYATSASCEDYYDEGRVPEVVASSGQTWYPDHRVTEIELAYCTGATTGTVDLDWELYDTQLGLASSGSCAFGTSGVPPKFTAGIHSFASSAAGFPLPGATGTGATGCWIVAFTSGTNSVCLNSGAASADQFVFRYSQNNTVAQVGIVGAGPWLAGNPNADAGGGGTFNIPPGTDPFSGGPCGHGLDSQDLFWLNTDGSAIGGTPPPCPDGGASLATNCYFFGGFPNNPFGSFYLRVAGDGSCSETGNTNKYCTAKVNSLGCTPTVAWQGLPSATGCAQPFTLTASNLIGNASSVWFYGTSGLQGVAFQGGHLCVKAPTTRLAVLNSGGSAGTCGGTNASNFNAQICSGADPALVPGALVGAQCYSRDPASPSKSNLTEGISFVIFP